jgi:hypothetical protein
MMHPEDELMLARQEIDRRVREAALHRLLKESQQSRENRMEPVHYWLVRLSSVLRWTGSRDWVVRHEMGDALEND